MEETVEVIGNYDLYNLLESQFNTVNTYMGLSIALNVILIVIVLIILLLFSIRVGGGR